ncbi:MAG: hypothetical protein FRX48_08711 [Lasallia pustulata]|uniref:Uncharacterized protein n=1 Tax=Lasallia pustulata TaxID=136370 RepID=A0A5M8PEW6_9LECA|nr:MAG: hypothetical protein FRX48_08711 [Lasallia pustulata]
MFGDYGSYNSTVGHVVQSDGLDEEKATRRERKLAMLKRLLELCNTPSEVDAEWVLVPKEKHNLAPNGQPVLPSPVEHSKAFSRGRSQ